MRCTICSSEGGDCDPNELSLTELYKIVDDSIQLGIETISLSGGEPLESPYVTDFIRYVKKKGLRLLLYTCGNVESGKEIVPIDSEHFQLFKEVGVDKIIFSIHGPNAEIHEKVTTKAGSFNNLITSIKRAQDYKHTIELHFVPVLPNYRSLPEIINLARKLNISKISILRFVPQGRGLLNQKVLNLDEGHLLELREILTSARRNSKIDIRLGAPFNCFHIDCETYCTAGIDKAAVRPDGIVVPCVSMKRIGFSQSLDNVRLTNIRKIWEESNLFNYIRDYHVKIQKSACRSCNYYSLCRGGCLTQRLIKVDSIDDADTYCLQKKVPNNEDIAIKKMIV